MTKEELKIGDIVKAIFRRYGRHIVIGEVWEIRDDNYLGGTWVSLRVTGGDMKDKQVVYMIKERINVMVPICDVKEKEN